MVGFKKHVLVMRISFQNGLLQNLARGFCCEKGYRCYGNSVTMATYSDNFIHWF